MVPYPRACNARPYNCKVNTQQNYKPERSDH